MSTWLEALEALRAVFPEYASAEQRRRLRGGALRGGGLRGGGLRAEGLRGAHETRFPRDLELFLQRVVCAGSLTQLQQAPSRELLERLRGVDFGHRQEVRRVLRTYPKLASLVHADVLDYLQRPRVLNEQESAWYESVRAMHTRATKENFLAALRHWPGDDLEAVAKYCASQWSPKMRRCIALVRGFPRELLDACITKYRLLKDSFRGWKDKPKSWTSEHFFALADSLGAHPFEAARLPLAAARCQSLRGVPLRMFRRALQDAGGEEEVQTAMMRIRAKSSFHDQLVREMLECERSTARTFFPEARLCALSKRFCWFVSRLDARVPDLAHFLRTASAAVFCETVRGILRDDLTCSPHTVKTQRHTHHALTAASEIVHFARTCLRRHMTGLNAAEVTTRALLCGLENKRRLLPADACQRRTLNDAELAAMLQATRDPGEALLMTLLVEVAPRAGALRYLRYATLLDPDTHEPRSVCHLPEKGAQMRVFLASENLQQRAQAVSRLLREAYPGRDLRDCYLLNLSNVGVPVAPCTIFDTVRRLAARAGVRGVRVHPHMFRHTLVGRLMEAGNSLEVVSKFMGHQSVTTTSRFYWVATPLQLRIITPEKAGMKALEDERVAHQSTKDQLAIVSEKFAIAQQLLGMLLPLCDPALLADKVPNLAHLLGVLSARHDFG